MINIITAVLKGITFSYVHSYHRLLKDHIWWHTLRSMLPITHIILGYVIAGLSKVHMYFICAYSLRWY